MDDQRIPVGITLEGGGERVLSRRAECFFEQLIDGAMVRIEIDTAHEIFGSRSQVTDNGPFALRANVGFGYCGKGAVDEADSGQLLQRTQSGHKREILKSVVLRIDIVADKRGLLVKDIESYGFIGNIQFVPA